MKLSRPLCISQAAQTPIFIGDVGWGCFVTLLSRVVMTCHRGQASRSWKHTGHRPKAGQEEQQEEEEVSIGFRAVQPLRGAMQGNVVRWQRAHESRSRWDSICRACVLMRSEDEDLEVLSRDCSDVTNIWTCGPLIIAMPTIQYTAAAAVKLLATKKGGHILGGRGQSKNGLWPVACFALFRSARTLVQGLCFSGFRMLFSRVLHLWSQFRFTRATNKLSAFQTGRIQFLQVTWFGEATAHLSHFANRSYKAKTDTRAYHDHARRSRRSLCICISLKFLPTPNIEFQQKPSENHSRYKRTSFSSTCAVACSRTMTGTTFGCNPPGWDADHAALLRWTNFVYFCCVWLFDSILWFNMQIYSNVFNATQAFTLRCAFMQLTAQQVLQQHRSQLLFAPRWAN